MFNVCNIQKLNNCSKVFGFWLVHECPICSLGKIMKAQVIVLGNEINAKLELAKGKSGKCPPVNSFMFYVGKMIYSFHARIIAHCDTNVQVIENIGVK